MNGRPKFPSSAHSNSLSRLLETDPVFVIMEWVNGGKLQSFLRKSRAEHYYGNLHGSSSHLTSRDLTSFAYQVARAMDYLTVKGVSTPDAQQVITPTREAHKLRQHTFTSHLIHKFPFSYFYKYFMDLHLQPASLTLQAAFIQHLRLNLILL